ncbi:MAG: DUF998 domain-containing protein [Ktedonobacteraceae bacterium]
MSKSEPETNGQFSESSMNSDSGAGSLVTRLLLACGVVGSVLFNIVYLIEGVTRSNYDAWKQPVSDLSMGSNGWMQRADFIFFGLFIACFAVGLRKALAGGIGATWVPLLQGLVALGLLGDGIFTQDPIHTLCDILTFSSIVVLCFVFAKRFARNPFWRYWATYSIATAILAVGFLTAFGVTKTLNGPAGFFERLATFTVSIWTILIAARLMAGSEHSSSPDHAQ